MASLKQLAGQTLWYGLSNIGAKFLNQLLTPIITYFLHNPAGMVDYGNFTMLYSGISFVNVLYTYGLETAYFRFSASGTDQENLFRTMFSSLLVSTVLFSTALILYRGAIGEFIGLGTHTEYVTWCVLIVAIDTMAAIPFARLRQEGRPRKYAFTRLAGIVVNIIFTVYLIAYYPTHPAANQEGMFARWYNGNTNAGFLIMANLAQSLVTFLLLFSEWKSYRFKVDGPLLRKILLYSSPMLIVGLGGMINETFDRIMLPKLLPASEEAKKIAVAIYGANYKLAIVITLFIQAFKMSAEPFFFSQSGDKNAPKTYARVMKWFVITLCLAFLFTALYIDLWKYFIGPKYRDGLGVVPILLAANVALGIYYNLSAWYKITDKMYWGMIITLIGAAITLALNFAFIPRFGMYACAWATFAAYTIMMVLSYLLGQRFYPVPYARKKLLSYMGVMFFLFFAQKLVMWITDIVLIRLVFGTAFMYLFIRLVFTVERKELSGMPVIGKWIPAAPKDSNQI